MSYAVVRYENVFKRGLGKKIEQITKVASMAKLKGDAERRRDILTQELLDDRNRYNKLIAIRGEHSEEDEKFLQIYQSCGIKNATRYEVVLIGKFT